MDSAQRPRRRAPVKYTLATRPANEFVEAADEKVPAKTIARYCRVDLLCSDGSATWNWTAAAPSCSSGACPNAKKRTPSPSQRIVLRPDQTFTDPGLCAAIVDSLTLNGAIVETGTDAYPPARNLVPTGHQG